MAFRTQKISQMTPKGANLEATDLIEVSTIESGSYVTRSITGQEIIDAAVGNVDWGDIGGTLSNQTDLQNALDAKQNTLSLTTTGDNGASTLVGSTLNVPNYTLSGLGGVPTSRTLTINGVTQDLSANRTFTISTGITIGSTAIASGVVGRVLFEGAGNVVQESSSLFWDNTNSRLGIGTSTPDIGLTIVSGNTFDAIRFKGASSSASGYLATGGTSAFFSSGADASGSYVQVSSTEAIINGASRLAFYTASTEKARIFSTGNIGINTTTDAGFRLDVNGNSRIVASGDTPLTVHSIADTKLLITGITGKYASLNIKSGTTANWDIGTQDNTGNQLVFRNASTARMLITTGGNVLIGTTTDAGFRLDVNGTTRVSGDLTVSSNAITVGKGVSSGIFNTVLGASPLGAAGSSTANYSIAIGRTAAYSASSGGHNIVIGTETAQLAPSINLSTLIGSEQFGRVTSAISQVLCIGTGDTVNYYPTIYATNIAGNTPSVRIGNNQSALASAPPATTASAILELSATTQGFLPPRMTTTQKNAIASPAAGLMVYDTTLNVISYYNGTMWI